MNSNQWPINLWDNHSLADDYQIGVLPFMDFYDENIGKRVKEMKKILSLSGQAKILIKFV